MDKIIMHYDMDYSFILFKSSINSSVCEVINTVL